MRIGLSSLAIPAYRRIGAAVAAFVSGAFASNGATFPNYAGVQMPAVHDSGRNRTYYAWEGWDGSTRVQYVSYINHATGYTGPIIAIGTTSMVDDDHGNPSIELDHEGHLWGFYGSHATIANSEAKISSTRWPIADAATDDGSLWAIRESQATPNTLTYPHPHEISNALYVLYRKHDGADNAKEVVFKTTALADGSATWGAETTLIDFGGTNRIYVGNTVVRDTTKIHFLASIADSGDTTREDVFYFVYDTTDGSVSNWNGSTSVASGSLPVDLTAANTSFRIFEHTGSNWGNFPSLGFDSGGTPHVCFLDGTAGNFALKHMTVSGGAWTAPETLDTGIDDRSCFAALVGLSSGEVEAIYPKDDSALWTVGGNMKRIVRSAAGTWGSPTLLLEAATKALDRPNPVRDGHADARVTFCEIAQGSDDSLAGGLNVYVWGASGLIGANEAPAAADADVTGDLLLGADNLLLGADQLTIDTTDG